MAHPVKKVYKEGSPGFNRNLRGLTLTQIKKNLNAEPNLVSRSFYVNGGELGFKGYQPQSPKD